MPAVDATSTTSYYDVPVTHRITNAGDRLFRFMVVTNASPGDDTAADHGFAGKAELSNRWFRAYRITLAPGRRPNRIGTRRSRSSCRSPTEKRRRSGR